MNGERRPAAFRVEPEPASEVWCEGMDPLAAQPEPAKDEQVPANA